MSRLDHPAKFAQTTAVPGPVLCDHRLDAAFAKFPAMWFGVVPAIGVNDFGFLERPATHTANRRTGIDERLPLGNVVVVCAGQDGTEGVCLERVRSLDKDVKWFLSIDRRRKAARFFRLRFRLAEIRAVGANTVCCNGSEYEKEHRERKHRLP